MLLLWFVLVLLGTFVLLSLPFLLGREFYKRYDGSRAVICPENHRQVAVHFDAFHAAVTKLAGSPNFRVADCTRWPERGDCEQECLPEACRAAAYTEGEVRILASKRIYHLPVLLAAFAAWALGAIWHSQYLFRSQWTSAVGLSRLQVHQLVWRLAPHVATFAAALLFAYGVAWWLSWLDKKGAWRGIAVAIALWGMVVVASLVSAGLTGLSRNLIAIELGYTFLASVLVGALIGGLSGKLVEATFIERQPAAVDIVQISPVGRIL
jgi:uncharacterized protein DUF1761